MDIIDIIVPCYNEEAVINIFNEEIQKYLNAVADCEMRCIFIDDGSYDNTLNKLRQISEDNNNVTYISLSRNFGKESAMMAGIDYTDADAVIIMDADLQHPPSMIPEMIYWWRQGYDDVCAKRTSRGDESWLKRTGANTFYKFLQKFSSYQVQPDVGDFRLLDKRCINTLRLMRENQRFSKGLFSWVGFKKKEIPFEVQERAAGTTNWNYLALVGLAMKGITSFTTVPLRFTSFLGLFVSFGAIVYMIFVLITSLIYGDPVAGYPTLMTVLLFLGGTQLLALGIIGEYIGQIFNESKHRPIYLIDEINGKRMLYKNFDRNERNFTPRDEKVER